ncbi:Uroporphyrin-III C-methyltransferase [Sodalis praecaptivus]|uniref:uroporphyrinogen-III C-methyltransferase n=1 Tax=Sodalis praecaptivus TaxID=1239307 RepID=W0HZ85_9GAMM|nr:uroporphyrinogen-III C-methyltransferase [Sodalis praecaptivus]AHF77453.1 Uroporphyrin-III C-methyltransferase [Sodalis praecaptivus]
MTLLSALTVPAPGTTGAVWLVGAGPGDAELLTLKALRAIEQATVVVVDRLVSDEVLALIPSTTPCIDAGKAPGRHGMKQQDINRLLVDLACAGHRVVRLKGGDPFIFGRGGEEMLALQRAGISCRVVPGITAAAGCAASTGIPLTHRECAQSVQFITGHGKNGAPALDWDALRDPRQTLVFYMGLTWCAELSRGLMDNGRAAHTPVAIIENGTRAGQRVLLTTLEGLARTVAREKPVSPSLLVVGEVVNLCRLATASQPPGHEAALGTGATTAYGA